MWKKKVNGRTEKEKQIDKYLNMDIIHPNDDVDISLCRSIMMTTIQTQITKAI